MPHREFWSADQRFGLRLPAGVVTDILRYCARAGRQETGGILVGRYTDSYDCAVVARATGAPADSRSGRTWFWRGVRGLQRLLDRMWQGSEGYYLGEWHFHPYAAPDPSGTDVEQVRGIAASESYQCPEPILLIVGGDPAGNWEARAFVFPHAREHMELLQNRPDTE